MQSNGVKEYWRWPEYRRTVQEMSSPLGKVVTAGVDVGSVSSKAALMVDGNLCAYSILRTSSGSVESADKALAWTLEETTVKRDDIKRIVATGYGRVNVGFADKTVTEISCHARGANLIWGPSVRTIVDMGGQDCKAIRCDQNGRVTSFVMNDKCAAGTGRGIEVFADLLQIPIEDIGPLSLSCENEPEALNSSCVVFQKSEAIGLLQDGALKENVLASLCSATARRVAQLLRRVGVEKELAVTGGIAKNVGVVRRLERELGVPSLPPNVKFDPQVAGAIGAALFATDSIRKTEAAQ
jgi:bzd-type benzoyl-CoA reductase Q subunit